MNDDEAMDLAITAAWEARTRTSPNPWVGAALVTTDGAVYAAATEPPGGRHAEVVAIDRARADGATVDGASLYSTLEPCSHHGRTPPCADAIVDAGVSRLISAIEDPDPNVSGRGHQRLRAGGVEVSTGVRAAAVGDQLAPYLHHRRTGRPYVVLKLAGTLDGRTATADGTSQWITSPEARADAHRLRAESDAICVGAGTVRADDPSLTVRHVEGRDPRRVVLGRAPAGARVHPCLEWEGDLPDLLDLLGSEGALQLLVEGGASTAHSFHAAGLVDRYVVYLAPALAGGDDGRPLFAGAGAGNISALWRGSFRGVDRLGPDVRLILDRQAS